MSDLTKQLRGVTAKYATAMEQLTHRFTSTLEEQSRQVLTLQSQLDKNTKQLQKKEQQLQYLLQQSKCTPQDSLRHTILRLNDLEQRLIQIQSFDPLGKITTLQDHVTRHLRALFLKVSTVHDKMKNVEDVLGKIGSWDDSTLLKEEDDTMEEYFFYPTKTDNQPKSHAPPTSNSNANSVNNVYYTSINANIPKVNPGNNNVSTVNTGMNQSIGVNGSLGIMSNIAHNSDKSINSHKHIPQGVFNNFGVKTINSNAPISTVNVRPVINIVSSRNQSNTNDPSWKALMVTEAMKSMNKPVEVIREGTGFIKYFYTQNFVTDVKGNIIWLNQEDISALVAANTIKIINK